MDTESELVPIQIVLHQHVQHGLPGLFYRVERAILDQMTADWKQHTSQQTGIAVAGAYDYGSLPKAYAVLLRDEPRVLLIRWIDVLYLT